MVNTTLPELRETEVKELPPADVETLLKLRQEACSAAASEFKLQPQQRFLRRVLSPDAPTQGLLMVHGTGTGKCHGKDTQILMYDGRIKTVQDVIVGDQLMGDDSTPRNVLSLARGRDRMFEITSVKGDSYTVNSEHILSLKYTGTNDIIDVPLDEYLMFSTKKKHMLKGYATGVDFPEKIVPFDPYVLGVWLGDGSSRDPIITSQDSTLLYYLREFANKNNLAMNYQSGYDYRFSSFRRCDENMFLHFLKTNNLIHNKHIPESYKINCRNVRLQILAGLIDTDGYLTSGTYEIIQKSKQLSDDICFLARSLGFATTTSRVLKTCTYKGSVVGGYYFRTFISGDISVIPVKIPRKIAGTRLQKKDVLKYGFDVVDIGDGDYYGFLLDGNHRYVLGNFTVTHNTCTGIQIAEEYILRPEFQNKKVFVLASPAVQDNFRHQIFDASQVKVDESGITLSKQCTGRRYLDIIQRTKAQSLSWSTQAGREGIMRSASKIIDEFYEFWGYEEFGNELERQTLKRNTRELDAWIRATYDNRLIIIDEAHNLRDTSETTKNDKIVNAALRRIIQTANGITLVLLTATPMYDTFDEVLAYFNMFLWNERKQTPSESLKTQDFFTKNGDFLSKDALALFHKLSNTYISYVKGENPFTFPFRLDPPADMLATVPRTHDMDGKPITNPIKYLKLSQAIMSPYQSGILRAIRNNKLQEPRVVCVLPDNKNALRDVMDKQGNQWKYSGIPFLSKSNVAQYSAKFASILRCISESQGVVLVYSNIVDLGAQLFAMCLEEHGFSPAFGEPLIAEPSGEVQPRSSGTYALFTSNTSRGDIKTSLGRLKQIGNKDGKDIRVIIASPKVSEGVDFKYVRQIHVLDPWYNMSRIEQVIGRGLRTCSHSALHPLEQNCTVYLHVNRHPGDTQEVLDEFIYREFVEKKAIRMAKVKKALMESAMDCKLEQSVNSLPKEWLDLQIRQTRAQRNETITEKLRNLTAPVFMNNATFTCDDIPEVEDASHTRPLSAILDVKDEILDKLMQLFADKPIWKHKDLLLALKPYDDSLIRYILQNAIAQGFKMQDKNGRVGRLEAKKGVYAFAVGDNDTMLDRLVERTTPEGVSLSDNVELKLEEEPAPPPPPAPIVDYKGIETEVNKHVWTPMALNYSYEIREWYYVDQLMNPDARREHILNSLNGQPPEYLKSMVIETPQRFYVFGPDEFYTPDKAKFVPIGPSLDAYKAWRNNLKDRFVAGKDNFFAAMKGNTLQFNVDDKKVPAERAERTKVIGGRSCAFFEEKVLTSFAKWFGSTLEKMKKQDRCMEISMLARKATLERKPGFDWYTPEEWAVLTEESTRKEILARLNPKKKK